MAARRSRLLCAFLSILSTVVAGAGLVALGTTPAEAAVAAGQTYNVVDRPSGAVTADALPTVQIDGVVWDTAIVGDTVYAGGQFANARPAGAAAGTNQTPRGNLLSFNLRTGALNTGFAPTVNGRIRTMALSPDKSRLYIAGSFTSVNGVARYRVAAFNTADGSLVSSFAPIFGSDVFALAVSANAVYAGGWFTSVNGVPRSRLAAVSPSTGATLNWAPVADSTVNTMTLAPDSSRVIVGGIFANLNGAWSPGMGSLDATTGAALPFAANATIVNYGNTAGIQSLKTAGNSIIGTGYWFGGTGNFEGVFLADPSTGSITSMADCHGDTYDATVAGDVLYTVSHHHDCSNINGFPDTNPRVRWQRANAFTLAPTTTVGRNTAGGYYDFSGQPAPSLVNWFPDVSVGSYTGQYQGGWTTESTAEYVVQGGEFPAVNNKAQQGLVRFAIPSIAPNKQGPRASAADSAPTVRAVGQTSARVAWTSNFDRDDTQLTYRLYRSDRGATPVLTQTVGSQFWNRPAQFFTDSGLTPGASYSYYVTATDPAGNTVKSASVTMVAGQNAVDDTAYSRAVLADGASSYWRLNEPAGVTRSTDWVNGNDLILGSGVSNGVAGAIKDSTDTAASFDGTGNGVASPTAAAPGSNTFTVEAWIKTTTTSGGKIIGFGDNQSGMSGSYDRQVYMDNSGRLIFGVYPGGVRTVSTSGSYNDGEWHQVVASLSPQGMALYVDGLLQGADGETTSAQGYTGYWRVGGDNLNGWPSAPSSYTFAGAIDDVAVYPTALSPAQIRGHYTASGRTVDVPAAPGDAYGQAVYDTPPSFYWRLDDPSGSTTAADASPGRVPGTVAGGVTFGVEPGALSGSKSATFNGSDGTVASSRAFTNPRTYTEELWFSTTTTDGGKLIGFGNSPSGYSSAYDRHVYMENSGQLTFGVWTGQTNTITTANSYNDGGWHYLVATQDATAGMRLYVDGVLVGTNPQTQAQDYTGYFRVGGDSSWGGNSAFFAGNLDEVAVYPVALTETEVASRYRLATGTANAAPTAAFTDACTELACDFDGTGSTDGDGTIAGYAWDFGDGATSTEPKPTHRYAAAGTYPVKLTVTDDAGATDSVTASVTVRAANVKPVASFTSSTQDLSVSVDAGESADADGSIVSYAWDYGDGATGSGKTDTHRYAAAGTYPVKLTVTDDAGATDSVTASVTVAEPPGAPALARDDFGRTGSRWGTADVGGNWADSGAAYFSTADGKGRLTLTRAGSGPVATLNSPSQTDSTTTVQFSVDKVATGSGAYVTVASRVRGNSEYRLRARLMADGTVRLITGKVVGGTDSVIREVVVGGLSYGAGEVLQASFTVSGSGTTTLKGTIWKAGSPQPAQPQLTSTDSTSILQGPGGFGLRGYLSGSSTSAPVTISFDNYLVVEPN